MSEKSYIVTFKNSATQEQIDEFKATIQKEGKIVHTYNIGSMRGFAVTSNEDTFNSFNNNLTGDSPIENIELDGTVTTQ
ncbi:proteinase inhibitor, propeptide [Mycena albidolilacea]|uniref:Proteinase inhibitor, propeptide n=1 Tax=Mycena albidolilacea TaxID=1033008 RepID=A0AAD7A0N7_9AGAR|nr:proteinase inhibitor, propeptide [Mycena albidolilacea]